MKGVVAIRPGGPEVLDAAQAPDEGVRPADRVMCLVAGGGNAQLAAVAAANCIPVPDGMSWHDAAAIPEVFITAYQGLVRLGRLAPDDIALVHSIASGVGVAAAQVCRAIGARCIGTSRTEGRAADGAPSSRCRGACWPRACAGGRCRRRAGSWPGSPTGRCPCSRTARSSR